ncbi:MAG: polysaccharide biosynthesis protein [Planctomycetota bacterium]
MTAWNPQRTLALLGREENRLDLSAVSPRLNGRRILVTGAGGSIGSSLCDRLLQEDILELIAVDHSEAGLYELSQRFGTSHRNRLTLRLADCCDPSAWLPSQANEPCDLIIHAAAHKHVPLLEANARTAFLNNVGAALAMARAVERLMPAEALFVSSDKAVDPTAIMGQTKRLAERLLQGAAESGASGTSWKTIRLANVLGSSGSVLPRFERALAADEALTLHGEDSTRFFISPREAVDAILAALVVGKSGDLVAADPGPAIEIRQLATKLAQEQGYQPSRLRFELAALRPGDRRFERLWHANEARLVPALSPLLLRSPGPGAAFSLARVEEALEQVRQGDDADAARILRDMLS